MSDGLDGLATLIAVASGAMVLGGTVVGALIGRLVASARSWIGSRRLAAAAAGAMVGTAAGTCLMTATFLETT